MLKQLNYSLRVLFKYRLYSGIALIGFGISLASIWFIADYVQQSYQYDAFHKDHDQIYRLSMEVTAGGHTDHFATTGFPVGDLLHQHHPEIAAYARLTFHNSVVKVKQEVFQEAGFFRANPQTLDVFSFNLLAGKEEKIRTNPKAVLLTRSLAQKYFKRLDVIGESITIGKTPYTVEGVFQDWPTNSHLEINALIFGVENSEYEPQNWFDLENYTYVKLDASSDQEALHAQLDQLTTQQLAPLLEDSGLDVQFHTQPLAGLYFSPGLVDDIPKGNRSYITALAIAGLLVFVIAGLNFINLNLTRSTRRSKEFLVKKMLGISRLQLRLQNGTEAMVMTIFIFLFSAILIILFKNLYFNYTGFNASVLSGKWLFIGIAPVIVFSLGLIGSSYSGIALSFSHRLLNRESMQVSWFKHTLLGLQYVLTGIILIITFTMGRQLDFLKNKDLGFSKEQVLMVDLPDQEELNGRCLQFSAQLAAYPAIKNISLVGGGATPGEANGKDVFELSVEGERTEKVYNIYRIDEHYFDLLDITMAAGRNFDADQLSDGSGSVIINETLARSLNWEDPLEKIIWYGGEARKVIGVVNNFHNQSLHHIIEPIVFLFETDYATKLLIKAPATEIKMIQSQWAGIFPETPFSLTYFDQFLENMYKKEERLNQLFHFFSMVALLLCCTGLFALFSLHVLQRTREMSIRKVLGADYWNLLHSITRNYRTITLLSIAIAIPIAWLVVNRWLEGFSYRIEPGPGIFILSGALILLVSVIVIAYHLIKILRVNPVDALKSE